MRYRSSKKKIAINNEIEDNCATQLITETSSCPKSYALIATTTPLPFMVHPVEHNPPTGVKCVTSGFVNRESASTRIWSTVARHTL